VALYHRLESPTQTAGDAQMQQASQEIWGKAPRNGLQPAVQAYTGPLPPGAQGVEFETDIPPDPGCPPGQAYWRGPRDGVQVDQDYAKIKVRITRVVI
jgi:hypothetical protein